MINADEALNTILSSVHTVGIITVSLEQASGLVLAEHIVAGENVPSFDNTSMDGYAVRSTDVAKTPQQLTVIDEVPAGTVSKRELQSGETISIMTGATIPSGADAVVQIEWTERINEHTITVLRPVEKGHNIRKAGNDIAFGATVLTVGQQLRSQEIGVLASLGKNFVSVFRPPVVAVLTTGNEIVEINKPLREGTIRNSNQYVLQSLVKELHCQCANIEIARDDEKDLKEKLLRGLNADVLITSGGVSAGTHDLVINVLKELQVEIVFWKVNIKPGMPCMFGMYRGKPVFGLPGNPVSTMVTFLEFVRPALLKIKGIQNPGKELYGGVGLRLRATLYESLSKKDGKRHFVRGWVENRDGALVVRSAGSQTSNVLTSLSKANCLIILPEDAQLFPAGEQVEIELL